MKSFKEKKFVIEKLPDSILKDINFNNWEMLFEEGMIIPKLDNEKKEESWEYVWKPEIMKIFIKKTINATLSEVEKRLPKEEPFLDSEQGCGCGVCNQIEMANKTIKKVKQIIKEMKK
jgi:hypothetical protein